MSKSIGSIVWPENSRDSVRLLLLYMSKVIEQLGISFDSVSYDPVHIVMAILSGKISDDDRRSALNHWWSIIDARGVRNFESKEVLVARLAVCLLSPTEEETWGFGEQLSWFLEVLGFLSADVNKAIGIMETHFRFVENA